MNEVSEITTLRGERHDMQGQLFPKVSFLNVDQEQSDYYLSYDNNVFRGHINLVIEEQIVIGLLLVNIEQADLLKKLILCMVNFLAQSCNF